MARSGRSRHLAALPLLLVLAAAGVQAGGHYSEQKGYDDYPAPQPYPDHGSCPMGSYRSQKTMECEPCPRGTFAVRQHGRSSCAACPSGRTTLREGTLDIKQCVCQPGFGRANGDSEACVRCPQGTYSFGDAFDDCYECPFPKTTSFSGAISDKDCVCPGGGGSGPDCDQCPQNMVLMSNGICGCAPGTGGTTCNMCMPGFYSTGGKPDNPRPVCKPCGLHFTSPPGAIGPAYCECEAGFGSGHPSDPLSGYTCELCPIGTYNPGPGISERHIAAVDDYGGGGGYPKKKRLPRASPCRPCNGGNRDGDFTTLDVGAKSVQQCVCAPGHGGPQCDPCQAGTFSPGGAGAVCQSCPGEGAGYTTVPYIAATSASSCVCIPGYGMSDTGLCRMCPPNSFSEGISKEDCKPCPFGFTSQAAATGPYQCLPKAQFCPIGQWAPRDAVSADQCACYPGYGGGAKDSDACDICPAGTYSPGHSRDRCIPCGFGFTSPIGAKQERDCYPVDACPAGTEVPHGEAGASSKECVCKPGFGSPTGEAPCRTCPVGSYSPGGTMEDCKPCPFGHTSKSGARSKQECEPIPQACPVGQIALAGAISTQQCVCLPGHGGGRKPGDPCTPCPPGTWAGGDNTQPCVPCGFGYTSPEAATCPEECYPINACPAGTQYPHHEHGGVPVSIEQCVCKPGFGSSTGKGICSLCPVGTFSDGGSMEDCKPCPFGFTSAPGACSMDECRPAVQACPIGQWAPFGAGSPEECRCYKGFGGGDKPTDACSICPAGTYSPGVGTERCVPCGFGFTSPEGACSPEECYPVDQCPAGTEPSAETLSAGGPQTAHECTCKPGYGAVVGEGGCHLCPPGTYGKGGSLEDCIPCPFGYTSAPGTTSWKGCVPSAQECPVGQLAPLGAVSKEECGCLPGHGGGATPQDACSLCPVGTWASGGDTNPCIPCDFGYTSPEGATCAEECHPINACPPGTTMPKYGAASAKECVCLPGYGTESQEGGCSICPSGYYRNGFAREPCVPCPFGMTSPAGAELEECVPMAQPCPVGQIVDPADEPVSASDCHCLPGFGGGATPQDACSVCPVGHYSPGIGTQPCFPCPFGYTSPVGSLTPAACYEIEACPGGTLPAMENPSSTAECACIPGFGSPTGIIGDPCFWCPPDTFNEGFNWDGCKECADGSWAPSGSSECYPIGQEARSNNRTAPAAPAPNTPPSGFFRQWQPPKAVPMAFMSLAQPMYAAQPLAAITPMPAVGVNALQQQQLLKRGGNPRRVGAPGAGTFLQDAAASSMLGIVPGAYEMQMPSMPMADLAAAPQEWAVPYSSIGLQQEDAGFAVGGGFSTGRLGQVISEMQGTSPNPAFLGQPGQVLQQQQQQVPLTYQQPAYQQQQPPLQQQQPMQVPVQQQQQPPLQQQQQQLQESMPVPQQQPMQVPRPPQKQQPQQAQQARQQLVEQSNQAPVQRAMQQHQQYQQQQQQAWGRQQQQQQRMQAVPPREPFAAPAQGTGQLNFEQKPAATVPAPAAAPPQTKAQQPAAAAPLLRSVLPQPQANAQPAPTAGAPQQKLPAPAAATPQQQMPTTPASAVPQQKPLTPAPAASPAQQHSAPAAAPAAKQAAPAPEQKTTPAVGAPVQQQKPAAPAAAPTPTPTPMQQATTQAATPSSTSSSMFARPLAAVRKVVRRYVSSAQPAQLVANDELISRAVTVAAAGLEEEGSGVSAAELPESS